MAETNPQLKGILQKIRDDAQHALTLLEAGEERRNLGWKCTGCGHVKHFTRPVPAEVASPCPKCRAETFQPC